MPNTNDSHGESKIIFEDYDWLIVEPLDYDSYVYNAPDGMKSNWGEFRNGNIYFIVDKNNNATYAGGFRTYTIYKDDNEIEFYNWNGKKIKNKKNFLEDFPTEVIEQINNIIGTSEIYELLVKIMSGEEVISYQLKNSDELISNFKYNKSNPKKGLITLYFYDFDDYLKLFNVNDDDKWFFNAIFNHYDTYEFYDSRQGYDEWIEGYMMDNFNAENLEKLKEIISLISPQYSDLSIDENKRQAAKILDKMFTEIDDIYSDWATEYNYCMNRGAEQWIESDLCGAFDSYGIIEKECFKTYYTTPGFLISLYKRVGDPTLTLSELLQEIVKDRDVGGWFENSYESDCVDFDNDSFQNYVTNRLEKIYDKLESSEDFKNVSEYSRIYQDITSKYPIDTNSKTKYGKPFKIIKINPIDNKIHVAVDMGNGKGQKRSYTEEEFNNFLVSPELFESKKIRKIY